MSAVDDANEFLRQFPADLPKPSWSQTEDCELVCLSWRIGGLGAEVRFEAAADFDDDGSGTYGYCMKVGDRFKAGELDGNVREPTPSDLVTYLRAAVAATNGHLG